MNTKESIDWKELGKEKHVVIPEGVACIPTGAFKKTEIQTVEIPASVTTIKIDAFAECKNLQEVKFAENSELKAIFSRAFRNCYKLNKIKLPASLLHLRAEAFLNTGIEEIQINSNLDVWGRSTFKGCEKLKKVTVDEGVTIIPEETFYHCYALETISFPNTLKGIGSQAFEACNSLKEIQLPASLKILEPSVFYKCSALTKVMGFEDTKVEYIPTNTFGKCIGLTDIQLPHRLQRIGSKAFKGCSISDISLPKNLKRIEEEAFLYCTSLKRLDIPENVEFLGDRFIFGCQRLKQLRIPYSSMKNVGTGWAPAHLSNIMFDDLELSTDDDEILRLVEKDFKGTRLEDYFESIHSIFLLEGKTKAVEAMVAYGGMFNEY